MPNRSSITSMFSAWPDSEFDLKKVLLATICEIELFGWVSRTAANKDWTGQTVATSQWVRMHLTDRSAPEVKARIKEMLEKAEVLGINLFSFENEADEAIEWAKNLDIDLGRKDHYTTAYKSASFNRQIKHIAQAGKVIEHQFAWACAIIPSFRRWKENQKNPSNHVGTVGDTITLDVVITELIQHGSSWIIKGNVYNTTDEVFWWARSQPTIQKAQTIQIEARIKSHDSFAQRNQTKLVGVKIV